MLGTGNTNDNRPSSANNLADALHRNTTTQEPPKHMEKSEVLCRRAAFSSDFGPLAKNSACHTHQRGALPWFVQRANRRLYRVTRSPQAALWGMPQSPYIRCPIVDKPRCYGHETPLGGGWNSDWPAGFRRLSKWPA